MFKEEENPPAPGGGQLAGSQGEPARETCPDVVGVAVKPHVRGMIREGASNSIGTSWPKVPTP